MLLAEHIGAIRKQAPVEVKATMLRVLVILIAAAISSKYTTEIHAQEVARRTIQLEGWTVHISEKLLQDEKPATARAVELLTVQLRQIVQVLPAEAVTELRKVPLYFSPEYPGVQQRAEYHPGAQWLKENGRDPVMAKAVEFTNIRSFERETKRMPNFALHELAHAYHDRVLRGGFNNQEIKAAFEHAKKEKLYEKVEQRFGDGRSAMVQAYAITNPMEYFAEATEAYFTANDFFPFTREELKNHDPVVVEVLRKMWKLPVEESSKGRPDSKEDSISIEHQKSPDKWLIQDSGVKVSLRGICAVDADCCWASGAEGTVIRTTDGGKSWKSVGPSDTKTADFRDIHAWNESTAVIMSAGDPDRIYRTEDAGQSWTIVYEHPNAEAFFDGFAFESTGKFGWLMGDPIDGHVQLLRTEDAGKSWQPLPKSMCPTLPGGIAAFAASGTHLLCRSKDELIIGLGGSPTEVAASGEPYQASVLMTRNNGDTWQRVSVPIPAGPSSGIFSICEVQVPAGRLIAVGGDYQQVDSPKGNIAISDDGGATWRLPKESSPSAFCSVVVAVNAPRDSTGLHATQLIASGPSTIETSLDGGDSWIQIQNEGYHTMSFVLPQVGWAAGASGRIGSPPRE